MIEKSNSIDMQPRAELAIKAAKVVLDEDPIYDKSEYIELFDQTAIKRRNLPQGPRMVPQDY
jgi:hypothetical protein